MVRHEFGHALGMIHEHQNPTAKIPWDKPKVYAYYARAGLATRATSTSTSSSSTTSTRRTSPSSTRTSIMQYAIPEELTIGRFSVGWNTELSPRDIEFMGRQYPSTDAGEVELIVGARRDRGRRSPSPGEVNTFRFTVAAAATHVMTTTGALDTVLTLHGPGDPGTVAASDDDRGRGRQQPHRAPPRAGDVLAAACATRIRPVRAPTESGCRRYGDRRMGLFRRWNPVEPADVTKLQAELVALRAAARPAGRRRPRRCTTSSPRSTTAITAVSTELANQLTELGHDIDALNAKPTGRRRRRRR